MGCRRRSEQVAPEGGLAARTVHQSRS
jgi:hypothetical protein